MSDLKKKKILWVVYDFYQAGGQRYVYEICKALNKEKYDVDVLHINSLGSEKAWSSEYYYQPTLNSGCRIIDLQQLLERNRIPEKTFLQRAVRMVKKKIGINVQQYLPTSQYILKFLNDYDCVNFSGTAVYKAVCIERNIHPQNAIIHIITAQFQVTKDLYEGYDKSLPYFFVSSIPEKSQRQDLEAFENYQLTYFPLCFETKRYEVLKILKSGEEYKIAVFTRLSTMKPLDPYFYALKLLLEENMNVRLDIYGAGNPEDLGLLRQLNYLYLSDFVTFKGHTDCIEDTLKQGGIDLIWFQSNDSVPAGYAALEITMSAIPQVFWDFSKMSQKNSIDKIFPSFTSITAFAEFSKEILKSIESRNELGTAQRTFVENHNSIQTHIHLFEELIN